MPTMVSVSIWLPVSSVLSAYYCLGRHHVLSLSLPITGVWGAQVLLRRPLCKPARAGKSDLDRGTYLKPDCSFSLLRGLLGQ
jgi:hypothetical protein